MMICPLKLLQNSVNNWHQPPLKSMIRSSSSSSDSFSLTGCNSMILLHATIKFISTCAIITTQCAFTIVIHTVSSEVISHIERLFATNDTMSAILKLMTSFVMREHLSRSHTCMRVPTRSHIKSKQTSEREKIMLNKKAI